MKERTTWGTIRPTNTIGPQAAVAAPHSSVAAIMDSARVLFRFAPRARAVSSPIAMALSGRASARASTEPTAMNGSTCRIVDMSAETSEPTVQKRILPSAALSMIITAWR